MSTETPTERNRRIFEEAAAAGEPVFVIRAKDVYAPAAIAAYADVVDEGAAEDFHAALRALRREVQAWQNAHPSLVKTPDLREAP